jgi:hypothetical protein
MGLREQGGELDRKRREALLHRIQQLIHEKAMYALHGPASSSVIPG